MNDIKKFFKGEPMSDRTEWAIIICGIASGVLFWVGLVAR